MEQEQFNELISNQGQEAHSLEVLEGLAREYPYFSTAHILLAQNYARTGHDDFEKQLAKAAVYSTDRTRLHQLITSVSSAKEGDVKPMDGQEDGKGHDMDEEAMPYPQTFEDKEVKVTTPPEPVEEGPHSGKNDEGLPEEEGPQEPNTGDEDTALEDPAAAVVKQDENLPAETPEDKPAKLSAADELLASLRLKHGDDLKKKPTQEGQPPAPGATKTPDEKETPQQDEKDTAEATEIPPAENVPLGPGETMPDDLSDTGEDDAGPQAEEATVEESELPPGSIADDIKEPDKEALQNEKAEGMKGQAPREVDEVADSVAQDQQNEREESEPDTAEAGGRHEGGPGEKHTFTDWLHLVNKKQPQGPDASQPDKPTASLEKGTDSGSKEPKTGQHGFIDPVAQNESRYQMEAAKEENSVSREDGEASAAASEVEVRAMAQKSLERDWGTISETLAEIMANQGKTARAIEIYKQLSLKYPEKSGYFASQIDKLKK